MNRHFTDAWYHAKRAATNAYLGVREVGEPVEHKVREWTGRELDEPTTRSERVRASLATRLDRVEDRAEGRARTVYENARQRVRTVR